MNQTRVFLVNSYQQPTLAASKLTGDHYAGNQQNLWQEPLRKPPLKPLETTEGPGKGHHDLWRAPPWPENHQDKPKPIEYRIYQEHAKNKRAPKKPRTPKTTKISGGWSETTTDQPRTTKTEANHQDLLSLVASQICFFKPDLQWRQPPVRETRQEDKNNQQW